MATFGYKLSSEEHAPLDLVRYARRAEETGFEFALISDHFHPWVDKQGHSPFVWSVIGGIAASTEKLVVGTGVTCPTVRMHPAIVAHAAATSAAMLPGRFFLGVGSGEYLNEHVLGDRWPPAPMRLEMLEEAVEVIRKLFTGDQVTHRGPHYTVESARLYTLPDELPPVYVAASGPAAAEVAGRIGDGLVSIGPMKDLVAKFDEAGGRGKPRYAEVMVCWGPDEASARNTAFEWWPNAGVKGEMSALLPQPAHFEQAVEMVDEDDVVRHIACGPDPQAHIDSISEYVDAGLDHVCIHQIGPDQDGFFDFYESEVLPKL